MRLAASSEAMRASPSAGSPTSSRCSACRSCSRAALEDHCASLPRLAGGEALVDGRGEPAGDVCEHQTRVELRTQRAGDAQCLERSR
jgi:hypothetical protein